MSRATTSPPDDALVSAFTENEFDIAGLAEFSADDPVVDRCLRQLYSIVKRDREPTHHDEHQLAQVLLGMVSVARHDYAADGHQEYWPFLFGRIRDAVFADPERFWSNALANQQHQSLLGRWFRHALDAFGYSIPEEGQKYVGPIVFHAGIPRASLHGVLEVLATACEHYGPQTVGLPIDIRSALIENHFPPLHRNVQRLLGSNLQGAEQLWNCLTRVILAWHAHGDCTAELQQLPLGLDPNEVREALPTKTVRSKGSRIALPQLRYDPDTGEVRLSFPAGTSTDWKLTSAETAPDVIWSRTHLGLSAELRGPLPEEISVEPRDSDVGVGRTFCPRPSDWPGFWFHAHNGNLEDGRTIDASGLESGRWYVVFEGTPTECSVSAVAQVPLKWGWFVGFGDWTAWEINVPPRSADRTLLEWSIDDNCFSVPLARRPGPKVEFDTAPVSAAVTPYGSQLDVFGTAPAVTLRRDRELSVLLLSETDDSVEIIERFELQPERPTRIPVNRPGVYQLREARGVGRTLSHFAVIPELQVIGPEYNAKRTRVSVSMLAGENCGGIFSDDDNETESVRTEWRIESSTVNPVLSTRWQWDNQDFPELDFRWPIEAIRWRVTRAGGTDHEWTRDPVFISPKDVAEHDSQLEVQLPVASELAINDEPYTGRLQNGPSGSTLMISLLSYGETVELLHDDERYPAVFLSEQPLLDSMDGISDSDSLLVSWSAPSLQTGTSIVAWDPFDHESAPFIATLSPDELSAAQWEHPCSELPGDEWTAIALARSAGGFFRRVLHMAASRTTELQPIALLVNRSSGAVTQAEEHFDSWPNFVLYCSLLRLHRKRVSGDALCEMLLLVDDNCQLEIDDVIERTEHLQEFAEQPETGDGDSDWARAVLVGLIAFLNRVARDEPTRLLAGQSLHRSRMAALLRIGIAAGRSYPFRWIADSNPVPEVSGYPLAYIRDLWLLGTTRSVLAQQLNAAGGNIPDDYERMQLEAASRVLDFHRDCGLPSPSAFLPLGQQVATVQSTDRGHSHCFALPPLPAAVRDASAFCDMLGLQDRAIDCQATCDDQFFTDRPRRVAARQSHRNDLTRTATADYSLYWCSDEDRWAIEKPGAHPPTCCFTSYQPLVVAPVRPRELAANILRDHLANWARAEISPDNLDEEFGFLSRLSERVVSHEISGPLFAELLKPAETETKELFGKLVELETKPGLPPLATIAWQLAWIERVSAWNGASYIFGPTADPAIQRRFMRGLADAVSSWPELMHRCLALAELVYWTLYRGGLGAAARFKGKHTEQLLSNVPAAIEPTRDGKSDRRAARPKCDKVDNISGVIVGYDAGIGIVLLHHRSSPSLQASVAEYLKTGDGEQHWFASFRWRSLSDQERDQLQQRRQSRSVRKRSARSLSDVMCGLTVTCALEKQPTWQASRLKIEFSASPFDIPKHRRKQPQ